jgi:dTDP-4-dehydrorhamnose 3,5-epimerase-like enzyme
MNIINNNIFTDKRGGYLVPIEFNSLLFEPKRIFTIHDVPKNQIRGEHAHYVTQQIMLCVRGNILVYLDDGYKITETELSAGQSIYIPNMVWDYQKFLTGNEFAVVLASTHYDINDYILDKNKFYELIKK